MNGQINFSVAQFPQARMARRSAVLLIGVGVMAVELLGAFQPALAAGPDRLALVALVESEQGEAALQQVAAYAQQLGGWLPAPGDELVFDPYMSRKVRGASLDYDEPPDCSNPKVTPDEGACIAQFHAMERQVRFGRSLFTTPRDDGTEVPRPKLDDLLSTYIEEVGHSWQEYLYETDGRGSGARDWETSKAESDRWAAGREYQIKRYILSLDGSVLALSAEQRDMLGSQICEGYANPMGHEVPSFGAPQGWPNAQNWPVTVPTAEEFESFCRTIKA